MKRVSPAGDSGAAQHRRAADPVFLLVRSLLPLHFRVCQKFGSYYGCWRKAAVQRRQNQVTAGIAVR